MTHPMQKAADVALGSGALSSPLWLGLLETGSKTVVLVGGAVLIVLRVMIAWRDWRNGKKDG